MSDWTQELKDKLIADYESREPTPENSMEIVKELAEEYEKTANGVRIILSKAGVYIKKAAATASTSTNGDTKKAPRVSKADSQKALTDIISSQGAEVDEAIIEKMTGKAAQYFTTVITAIIGSDEEVEDAS